MRKFVYSLLGMLLVALSINSTAAPPTIDSRHESAFEVNLETSIDVQSESPVILEISPGLECPIVYLEYAKCPDAELILQPDVGWQTQTAFTTYYHKSSSDSIGLTSRNLVTLRYKSPLANFQQTVTLG